MQMTKCSKRAANKHKIWAAIPDPPSRSLWRTGGIRPYAAGHPLVSHSLRRCRWPVPQWRRASCSEGSRGPLAASPTQQSRKAGASDPELGGGVRAPWSWVASGAWWFWPCGRRSLRQVQEVNFPAVFSARSGGSSADMSLELAGMAASLVSGACCCFGDVIGHALGVAGSWFACGGFFGQRVASWCRVRPVRSSLGVSRQQPGAGGLLAGDDMLARKRMRWCLVVVDKSKDLRRLVHRQSGCFAARDLSGLPCSRGWHGGVPGKSPAPTTSLSVPAAVAPGVIFLLGDACHGAPSAPSRGLGSPGEIPSSWFPGGRWRRLRHFLLGGIVLESSHLAAAVCFYCRQDGGCRGSSPN
jgi:hypothetical protein